MSAPAVLCPSSVNAALRALLLSSSTPETAGTPGGQGVQQSPPTETFTRCALFDGLQPHVLEQLTAHLSIQHALPTDEVIFRSGADAQEMFFVIAGEVEIRTPSGACLASVTEGQAFGEIGVLFAGKRTADAIVSRGPCDLASLCRTDLERLARELGFQRELSARGRELASVKSWFVGRLPLFAHCGSEPGFLQAVAESLKVQYFETGEVVVQEGLDGNVMYFIFEGSVTVSSRKNKQTVQLEAPQFFGELALLYSEPRSATVACRSTCYFYVLTRDALHNIMQRFPRVIGAVYSTAKEAQNLKLHFIRKIPLFKAMVHDEEFVANMQLALESSSAAPGEFIMKAGDKSDGRMYIIAHGHASVQRVMVAGEAPRTVASLGTGAILGAVALLLDSPRTASVVARGHCHLYALSRDAFETLAVVYESWWREITSERGALLTHLKATGVATGTSMETKTHNLHIPEIDGISVSSILNAAEAPQTVCRIPEERLCLVCRSEEKCMLSVPCGHICACAECQKALSACPVCRKAIQSAVRAYF